MKQLFLIPLMISAIALGPSLRSVASTPPSSLLCQLKGDKNCQSDSHQISQSRRSEAVEQRFYCGTSSDGVPTTFVKNPKGTFPMIRWVSHLFDDAGYVPETRCRQVSSKFQQFYDRGLLNYVTAGRVNQQPVICVSNAKGGPCLGILFTLKPRQDANRTLQQLFNLQVNANAGPLEESGSRFYVDLNQYIETQNHFESTQNLPN